MTREVERPDEAQDQQEGLEGAEWAFVWAALTLAAIGALALIGWAWRAWPWW